ncbi:MAG: hypothetical protein A2W31_04885 [Planctomycetes bacterium RBG_16_64_10]|nr:MAG: hypothetical protein A2W31_04885 [Planctomycetes bacterium RBG_16_64_10]
MKHRYTLLIAMAVAVVCSTASANIVFTDLGTAAPPASLGGFAMTPFPDDLRDNGTSVTSVASPLGGTVDFSLALVLTEVGSGWATWSHGYTGDVYFDVQASSVTMTLPAQTAAFYFYAEPNLFDLFTIEAVADDGTTSGPIDVQGQAGANGYGFHGTLGTKIASIAVTVEQGSFGFAVGEFGIAIPTPSAVLLGLLGLGVVAGMRKCRLA